MKNKSSSSSKPKSDKFKELLNEVELLKNVDFKEEFNTEYQNASDKLSFFKKCYNEIDAVLHQAEIGNLKMLRSSFVSNYNFGDEIDVTLKKYSLKELSLIEIGKILSENKKYVDTHFNQIKPNSSKTNHFQFSIQKQLITLHYLGVLKIFKNSIDASKLALLISSIINRNPQDIRQEIGNFQQWLSPKDLVQKKKKKADLTELKNVFSKYNTSIVLKKIIKDLKLLDKQLDSRL